MHLTLSSLHPQPQATIIRIPVSLSDVYDGTWSQAANGDITSQWSFGGSFFLFQGRTSRTSKPATFLANINATVPVGGYRIPVRLAAYRDAATTCVSGTGATGVCMHRVMSGAVSNVLGVLLLTALTSQDSAWLVQVDSSAKFTVGQWIRIFVNDQSTKGVSMRVCLSSYVLVALARVLIAYST